MATYQDVLNNLSQGMAGQDFQQYASQAGVPVTYNQDTNRLLVNNTAVDMTKAGLQNQNGQLVGSESAYQQLLAPFLEQNTNLMNTTPYQTPEYVKQFMQDMIEKQLAPWNYNMDEDPSVVAARQQLEQSVSQMAGQRGFLYGSNQQDIVAQEFSKIAPMFEEAAYRKQQDFLNRQIELAGVIMQWDDLQANRKMKEAELMQIKADFLLKLDARDLDMFKTMLAQRRFEMELALDTQRLDMMKKEFEMEKAWKSIDTLGYANNETAITLGIKPGTEAGWVKKMIAEHQQQLSIMAQQHKYDLAMLNENKKIEMEMIREQQKVQTESELRLMQTEYGFTKALVGQKEIYRREYEAKQKAEAEAAAEAARREAEAAAAAKEKAKDAQMLEDYSYKYAKNQMMAAYGKNSIVQEKYLDAATKMLYEYYKAGTISISVYNRLKYEYGLPDYQGNYISTSGLALQTQLESGKSAVGQAMAVNAGYMDMLYNSTPTKSSKSSMYMGTNPISIKGVR